MKIIKVEVNKKPEVVEIDGSLESMQKIVGGYIETVTTKDKNGNTICIVLNEEGKLLELPQNRMIVRNGITIDYIVGNFFICGIGEDDLESLTETQIEDIKKMFIGNTFNL